ncbi:MAG: hypothetical protein ACRCUP_01485 [Mycoplasmatales bacterium]
MILDLKELIKKHQIEIESTQNYESREVSDALVKSINTIDYYVKALAIEFDEYSLEIEFQVNANYLDARTLKELNVNFNFEENIIFTSSEKKSEEFEIELIQEEELDLDELLFELAVVNMPFNYSEADSNLFVKEEELEQTSMPFKNLLK